MAEEPGRECADAGVKGAFALIEHQKRGEESEVYSGYPCQIEKEMRSQIWRIVINIWLTRERGGMGNEGFQYQSEKMCILQALV